MARRSVVLMAELTVGCSVGTKAALTAPRSAASMELLLAVKLGWQRVVHLECMLAAPMAPKMADWSAGLLAEWKAVMKVLPLAD